MPPTEIDLQQAAALGRVEGKIDSLIVDTARMTAHLESHGKRIGSLEQSRARFMGIVTVLACISGGGSALLSRIFFGG